MRTFVALLTLFATQTSASDFRAVDIGQPCSSVQAWEIAQGSTQIPWTAPTGAETYAFKARQFDQQIVVMYFCIHGSLFTGNYFFPIELLKQAVESYRSVDEKLLSSYGETFIDNSPWNRYGEMRLVAPDARNYMTVWTTARVSTTLSLMPNQPSENPGLRVFLVISAARK
jgi:hypothetical protein